MKELGQIHSSVMHGDQAVHADCEVCIDISRQILSVMGMTAGRCVELLKGKQDAPSALKQVMEVLAREEQSEEEA